MDDQLSVSSKAEYLRSFSLFRDCPDEFFTSLAVITEGRSYVDGTELLKEGQLNNSLFFLLSGKVDVLVQGELVVTLDQAGDVLGEMSLITSRPVSASIIARSPITVLVIEAERLQQLISGSQLEFGYYLYRTFSNVLSEKMILTNDKARRFEIANRALTNAVKALEEANNELDRKVKERTKDLELKTIELQRSYQNLETQNMELLASHRKLEDLYSSKDLTFKKLIDLQTQHLSPLLDTLVAIEPSLAVPERGSIERAKAQVGDALEMLRPIKALYSSEQLMRSRRVLLAEKDRKQQVIAKLALGGTGVALDIVSSLADAHLSIESGAVYDLIFVSPELADFAEIAHARLPSAKLVYMASSEIPEYLPILRKHPILNNIVSRDTEDRTFTIKNIMTTVSKLVSHDIFGLEKYLTWGVDVHTRKVVSSGQRQDLIEGMRQQFSSLGVRNRILDSAYLVSEELLMNAIYDAPIGADGKSLYNHLARTEVVELSQKHQGEYCYACDGMLAAVSVADPFGAFTNSILLDYLERNYRDGGRVEVQSQGKGGAGRGLHQIIENSDLVVFNVRPKVRTEVIALFNLDPLAKTKESKPAFHFFID